MGKNELTDTLNLLLEESEPIYDHVMKMFNTFGAEQDEDTINSIDQFMGTESIKDFGIYLALIAQMLIFSSIEAIYKKSDINGPTQKMLKFINAFGDEEATQEEIDEAGELIDTLFHRGGNA